jgi:hypothetical protein
MTIEAWEGVTPTHRVSGFEPNAAGETLRVPHEASFGPG